jgi:hypothetical protein
MDCQEIGYNNASKERLLTDQGRFWQNGKTAKRLSFEFPTKSMPSGSLRVTGKIRGDLVAPME